VLLDLSQLATHFTEKFLWGPTVPLGDVIIKIDMKKKQNINNTCNLLFMASLLVSNHKIPDLINGKWHYFQETF